jgi:hypothetical protein
MGVCVCVRVYVCVHMCITRVPHTHTVHGVCVVLCVCCVGIFYMHVNVCVLCVCVYQLHLSMYVHMYMNMLTTLDAPKMLLDDCHALF